ncbi:hypothetical protein [Streptomyces sp. SID9727]|uniref:hypothetical protein n=1 Tax=Streptomyces sp. SID9727 TaxID=2706114 RepID=UPI0013DA0EB0|nr:hypothetical protein [Streptomyces sp. SID9727]
MIAKVDRHRLPGHPHHGCRRGQLGEDDSGVESACLSVLLGRYEVILAVHRFLLNARWPLDAGGTGLTG